MTSPNCIDRSLQPSGDPERCTGTHFQRLAIIAAQRRAQLCLFDDAAQVFQYRKARVIPSVALDRALNLAGPPKPRF